MIWFIILFGLVLTFYLLIISNLVKAWGDIPQYENTNTPLTTKVSVIIAARNEEKNILHLLMDLHHQNFPKNLMEVIIIDDHSDDNTYSLINNFHPLKVILLKLDESSGKKNALSKGIEKASGELIVTTDADCRVGKAWLQEMVSFYEQKRPMFISGPVTYSDEVSMFEKVQSLELNGLILVGAASIQISKPIMCNGANLAFPKKVFLEVGGYTKHQSLASGDDMFLMMEIASRYPDKILFIKSVQAIVSTKAQDSFNDFLNQRVRWSSKNFHQFNFNSILTGAVVFSVNAGLIIALFLSFFNIQWLIPLIILLSIKTIIDGILLYPATTFFNKKDLMLLLLPAQFFIVFYSTIIIPMALSGKYIWKGRKLK